MAAKTIIVVGASAGGVPALKRLVSDVPPELPAAIFVTLHVPWWHRSELPRILEVSGKLRAVHPLPGQQIEAGQIYVAPPDHHLLIEQGHVQLWRGPKENRQRPAINVMFRSAAMSYGERVIGVVLSGMLDDGAAGLWWIKRFRGVTVVQDPGEAAFPDMPCAALEHVEVDYVVGISEMGPLLSRLSAGVPANSSEEAR